MTHTDDTTPIDGTAHVDAGAGTEIGAHTADVTHGTNPATMLVVANPAAGGDAVAAGRTVASLVADDDRRVRLEVTERPGHATTLVEAAIDDGATTIVAVGGDGTVNEVVNGMVHATSGRPRADDLRLGLVAAGSGADFSRTFGLHLAPDRAARHLRNGTTMPIDLGRVTCVGHDGQPVTRMFANIADIGWIASVVRRTARLPRLVGRSRYLIGALASARAMRPEPVTVTLDHTTRDDEVCQVLVANGQFFGSGFRVAPRALPDDGVLNVQTWGTRPRDILSQLPRLRVGEHIDHPAVREWQSRTVAVAPASGTMEVEVDGEPIGTTPARIDVVEQVIGLAM